MGQQTVQIWRDECGSVTVRMGDKTYYCPEDGGYVRTYNERGELVQVAVGLRPTGATLRCPGRDQLVDVIARQYSDCTVARLESEPEIGQVVIVISAPDYCTQNDGDCETCSLVNYGRDCKNNPV